MAQANIAESMNEQLRDDDEGLTITTPALVSSLKMDGTPGYHWIMVTSNSNREILDLKVFKA